MSGDDLRCPECGEPIGQTATYCMHCSADLTAEHGRGDTDGDETWDRTDVEATGFRADTGTSRSLIDRIRGAPTPGGQWLAPDSVADNALTVAVGIAGGLLVGVLGTVVLGALTGSPWAIPFGFLGLLVATAYLVRRRTVQGAVARSGYAVAVALLLVPVVALSPLMDVDGGLTERGGLLVVLLATVAVPAAVAAGLGYVASRFVPDDDAGSEG